jgi:hypothetical protein
MSKLCTLKLEVVDSVTPALIRMHCFMLRRQRLHIARVFILSED